MKKAFDMPEKIEITTIPDANGTYKYSGKYALRETHNPWVWVLEGPGEEFAAHFTAYANGFDKGQLLTRFHLSIAYEGHQGLHLWFNVNSTGQVSYTNADGKRLQSNADAAEAWAKKNKRYFVELAQAFVNKLVL